MKCTSKGKHIFVKKLLSVFVVLFAFAFLCILAFLFADIKRPLYGNITLYEQRFYDGPLREAELYASDLCVSDSDVNLEDYRPDTELHATALFDIDKKRVIQGYHLYDSVYPASTTKILTAYTALKYGNPEDIVTVSESVRGLPWDAQVCGLKAGDKLSLYDLLCGLLLYSGNDNGIAIAEHISGSIEAFAELMNEEAWKIGATGTHFVNPHGLHSEEHYTTAYDLYLIFQECMKYSEFAEIVAMESHTAAITDEDGEVRNVTWLPTNHYSRGYATLPEKLRGLGGKTGYTDEAGSCLVYSSENEAGNKYISVVMGAEGSSALYEQMNALLLAGMNHR